MRMLLLRSGPRRLDLRAADASGDAGRRKRRYRHAIGRGQRKTETLRPLMDGLNITHDETAPKGTASEVSAVG